MMIRLFSITAMSIFTISCSAPAYFSFQSLSYFDNTSSQAQVGNLGIRAKSAKFGFHRGAFLSDCGVKEVPLHVDSRIPFFKSVVPSFGEEASLEKLSPHLGYELEVLERMSVLVLSVDPMKLTPMVKDDFNDTCKAYIQRNGDASRLVTSVAVLVDLPILQETKVDLRVHAVLHHTGHIGIEVVGERKPVKQVVSPNAGFAYRYAHLCWKEEFGSDILVRASDKNYAACPDGYDESVPENWTWSVIGQEDVVDEGADKEEAPAEPPAEAEKPAEEAPQEAVEAA
ncbi:MAG: hypothetical protein QGI45_00690, partial [Myxococcota bacterium]|nr:hypothetical protein [Myxococcota bacterium]